MKMRSLDGYFVLDAVGVLDDNRGWSRYRGEASSQRWLLRPEGIQKEWLESKEKSHALTLHLMG